MAQVKKEEKNMYNQDAAEALQGDKRGGENGTRKKRNKKRKRIRGKKSRMKPAGVEVRQGGG